MPRLANVGARNIPITQRFDAQMRGYHRHSSPLRDSWRRTLTASIPERNPAAASQSAGNRMIRLLVSIDCCWMNIDASGTKRACHRVQARRRRRPGPQRLRPAGDKKITCSMNFVRGSLNRASVRISEASLRHLKETPGARTGSRVDLWISAQKRNRFPKLNRYCQHKAFPRFHAALVNSD